MAGTLPPLVLAYHGIARVPFRRDPDHLFVRPADLRRHMRVLLAWGYEAVRFGDLARRAPDERAGLVALTFDDGLADNREVLLPVLVELGVPATVFVVSSWLGGAHPSAPDARILSVQQLRELHDAGVEIGAHSMTHPDLTTLSREEARAELEGSRVALEELIGAPVHTAAYPYGAATGETIRACAEAGFEAAARTSGQGSWEDPLALPRQPVGPGTTMLGLRLKRDDAYERLLRRRPAAAARRAVHLARRVTR